MELLLDDPCRFEAAQHAAVQLLEPNVAYVSLPEGTLNDEAELKAWLTNVESLIRKRPKSGHVSH